MWNRVNLFIAYAENITLTAIFANATVKTKYQQNGKRESSLEEFSVHIFHMRILLSCAALAIKIDPSSA